MKLYVDFETYSDTDVAKVGAFRYAEHPSTDILCMAYAFDDLPVHLWRRGDYLPEDVRNYIELGGELVAHNAEFEWAIWQQVGLLKLGWPALVIQQLRDTAAMLSAAAYPRGLDNGAKALGIIGKDKSGKNTMLKLSKPRKATTADRSPRYTEAIHPAEFDQMYRYCIRDVETMRNIDRAIPDLTAGELRTYQDTLVCNATGVPLDSASVKAALKYIQGHTTQLNQVFKGLTGGILPSQRNKLLDWFLKNGVMIPNLQSDTVAEWSQRRELPEMTRKALLIRHEINKSSTKKYKRMLDMICTDGTVKGNLVYHGAATGRFNGVGVQFLNLPRGNGCNTDTILEALHQGALGLLYEDPMDALKTAVRSVICAPTDQIFTVGDFKQIETRVLNWLAEQQDVLDEFKRGLDPYKVMAATLYHAVYDRIEPSQRQFGKAMVLGCGFGQGADSFQGYCNQNGIEATEGQAKDAVAAYRSKHDKVVSLWHEVGKAAMSAVRHPGQAYRIRKLVVRVNQRGALEMRIPSGRVLSWQKIHIAKVAPPWDETREIDGLFYWGVNPVTKQWDQRKTYGGDLVQSATQGLSRDILIEAWRAVTHAQHTVVGMIHDELIGLGERGRTELQSFLDLMCVKPAWADDNLLIEADGYQALRYRK